jgi:hypothetical protein
MFAGKTWITNEYKKVKNPTKVLGTKDRYEGVLDEDFDFKYQKDNFEKIRKSLEPFGIEPKEIYYATRVGKPMFIVTWSSPYILWNKYEANSYGSGQNYIFYKNHSINTTIWIQFTSEDILQIFNGNEEDAIKTINKFSNIYVD